MKVPARFTYECKTEKCVRVNVIEIEKGADGREVRFDAELSEDRKNVTTDGVPAPFCPVCGEKREAMIECFIPAEKTKLVWHTEHKA